MDTKQRRRVALGLYGGQPDDILYGYDKDAGHRLAKDHPIIDLIRASLWDTVWHLVESGCDPRRCAELITETERIIGQLNPKAASQFKAAWRIQYATYLDFGG